MSRTYRRRRYRQYFNSDDPLRDFYVTEDEIKWDDVDYVKYTWEYGFNRTTRYNVKYMHNSKTGRRLVAIARSDAATCRMKEPGPHHFRNLTSDRPLRRSAKEEIRKYMYNSDYEVMILEMPYLEYWT